MVSRTQISEIMSDNPHSEAVKMLFELFDEDIARRKKVFQDEINRLKQQHAEDLEVKDNLVKMQSETIQYLEREVTKFDGYRQAVKDILGGEV